MAFKSANFLERHRNYSELHQRNLKERDEVEKMKLDQSIKDSLLGMLILPLLLYVLVHALYYNYYTGNLHTYKHKSALAIGFIKYIYIPIGAHIKIYIDSYVNTYCINIVYKYIHICILYIHVFKQVNLRSSKAYLTATDSGTTQAFRPCAVGGHSLQAALLRLQTLLANSEDNRVRILSPHTSTYH